jgi:hypothetical protein
MLDEIRRKRWNLLAEASLVCGMLAAGGITTSNLHIFDHPLLVNAAFFVFAPLAALCGHAAFRHGPMTTDREAAIVAGFGLGFGCLVVIGTCLFSPLRPHERDRRDRTVRHLKLPIADSHLRALITRNGGEAIKDYPDSR